MELLTVKNLIYYWKVYGATEMPKAAKGVISDTISALEEYKKVLEKED